MEEPFSSDSSNRLCLLALPLPEKGLADCTQLQHPDCKPADVATTIYSAPGTFAVDPQHMNGRRVPCCCSKATRSVRLREPDHRVSAWTPALTVRTFRIESWPDCRRCFVEMQRVIRSWRCCSNTTFLLSSLHRSDATVMKHSEPGYPRTRLQQACKSGFVTAVRLYRNRCSPSQLSSASSALMSDAPRPVANRLVKVLLERRAYVDAVMHWEAAIHVAVEHGDAQHKASAASI